MGILLRRRAIRALGGVAPECAAIACLLALIWWGSFVTVRSQYDSALAGADRDTANLAHAFQENTQRIVAGADQVLMALRAAYQRDRDGFDLKDWVSRENAPDWLTAQIAVIDADGMSIASTASAKRVSVADREHFIVQRVSPDDALFISKPVLGRSSGRWTIQMTRKMVNAAGKFAGVVVVSVDCYQLSGFYQSLNLEQGYIELVGLDGVVRARGPFEQSPIGATLPLEGPVAGVLHRSRGSFRLNEGRNAYVVSYRRLPTYPVVVLVAFSERSVLAAYRHLRTGILWSDALATLVIVGLGTFWIRQRKRSIESRQALALTLENMNQGLVMIDSSHRVQVVNARALELLRLPSAMLAQFRSARNRNSSASDHLVVEALAEALAVAQPDPIEDLERKPLLEATLSRIPDGGVIHTITDVSARRAAEQRIRHMALHDHLTGLCNRAMFADEADGLLQSAAASSTSFAILCLDLNGFKKVNDTFGHEFGDDLLTHVAARLTAVMPVGNLLARTGGDEFTILCHNQHQPSASEALACDIRAALDAPFVVAGQTVHVGACIGIALYPESGSARAELLRNADLALYAAKAERERPVRIYESSMTDGVRQRLLLEEQLRAAIDEKQLYLDYQPQFRTSTLAVVGFEALVRWDHPTRGKIRPDVFIPLAEETGLIIKLGRQILEAACQAALRWPATIRIAVNLSPVQFRDPSLVDTIRSVLTSTGLPASRLELEVTEGVLIADEQQAVETLCTLRKLGVTLALDDFGTGYASLSYLRKFPFDTIKLDRSFVQAQVLEERSRHILRAVLALSRSLGLNVVAEGVETRTQLALLREQGCQVIQGFLVGKPMPESQTGEMVEIDPVPRASCDGATTRAFQNRQTSELTL